MAKLLKLRGGTTSQHSSFTGADREVTVDTDKETLVVHNGSQAGGYPLARADGSGVSNFTITGELDCATLDVSGDADIDGTLEADAITVNGVTLAETIADTVGAMVGSNTETNIAVTYEDSDNTLDFAVASGISNGNLLAANANVADNDFLRIDGTAVEGRTAAETLSDIGAQAALTFGIADTNVLRANANVADDDFLRVDGTSIEGRTAAETLSDIGAAPAAGSSNILTTGALDSGSITSGFGNIDNGASNITSGGLIKIDVDADADDLTGDSATGRLTIGAGEDLNIYHGGTNSYIVNDTNDLIIDTQGDITLDADGGDIRFKDGGTTIGEFTNSSSDFVIKSVVNDKDIIFKGEDGGSQITALTLDMSSAGAATFNNNVTAYSDERLKSNIETIENGLEKVEKLRGVTYTRDERDNIGVIAQEVEKVLPDIVLTADDMMGTKSVDYSRITAVLIEAVKELSARVKELEDK